MPYKSDKQRKFMGTVLSYKLGHLDNPSQEIIDAAKSMSVDKVKEFLDETMNTLDEATSAYGRGKLFNIQAMKDIIADDNHLTSQYSKMKERGKEIFGYHYNEIILSVMFLKYIKSNKEKFTKYLKYKDQAVKDQMLDKDKQEALKNQAYLDSKKPATSSSDKTEEESLDETTTSASSGAYSSPVAFAKNKENWRFGKNGGMEGATVIEPNTNQHVQGINAYTIKRKLQEARSNEIKKMINADLLLESLSDDKNNFTVNDIEIQTVNGKPYLQFLKGLETDVAPEDLNVTFVVDSVVEGENQEEYTISVPYSTFREYVKDTWFTNDKGNISDEIIDVEIGRQNIVKPIEYFIYDNLNSANVSNNGDTKGGLPSNTTISENHIESRENITSFILNHTDEYDEHQLDDMTYDELYKIYIDIEDETSEPIVFKNSQEVLEKGIDESIADIPYTQYLSMVYDFIAKRFDRNVADWLIEYQYDNKIIATMKQAGKSAMETANSLIKKYDTKINDIMKQHETNNINENHIKKTINNNMNNSKEKIKSLLTEAKHLKSKGESPERVYKMIKKINENFNLNEATYENLEQYIQEIKKDLAIMETSPETIEQLLNDNGDYIESKYESAVLPATVAEKLIDSLDDELDEIFNFKKQSGGNVKDSDTTRKYAEELANSVKNKEEFGIKTDEFIKSKNLKDKEQINHIADQAFNIVADKNKGMNEDGRLGSFEDIIAVFKSLPLDVQTKIRDAAKQDLLDSGFEEIGSSDIAHAIVGLYDGEKFVTNDGDVLNEESKHPALTLLDRVHNQNKRNEDDYFKSLNKGTQNQIKNSEEGNKPFEYEYDDKDTTEMKQVNTDNKFTRTDKINDYVALNRGRGAEDLDFDIKPTDKFLERMKADLGDERFKGIAEKARLRKLERRNQRDVEIEINDKDLKDRISLKESKNITGYYIDNLSSNKKFVTVDINNTPEVIDLNESTMIKLNCEGMGNTLSSTIVDSNFVVLNENIEAIKAFDYYFDKSNNKVVKHTRPKQSKMLNESIIKDFKKSVNFKYKK